jgi:hypothetical protein
LSPSQRAAIGQRWRDEGSRYAREQNAFHERVHRLDVGQHWGEPPHDTRSELAETILEAVREANESGDLAQLREQFPPAHAPFGDRFDENGQWMKPLLLLDDGQILVRAGDISERSTAYLIDDLHVRTLRGILSFGRSPDRRYFAIARKSGITIHRGWEGPVITSLAWPKTGRWRQEREFAVLVPFPDGRRVLLGNRDAIMVLEPGRSTVLFAREEEDEYDPQLNNPHGAVSPDGSLISIGDRLTCAHMIFNDRYDLVGEITALWDVAPCHASFSDDGRSLALSSFMLWSGATVLVPTRRFPGLTIDDDDLDRHWHSKATWAEMRQGLHDFEKDLLVLDCKGKVSASAWRPGEFILGDAFGYLWAFDQNGERLWDHFIGDPVDGIDISRDGRRLVASTYAGFVVILDLDTDEVDPYRIGTSTHRELRRWLFWSKEKQPLAW